MAEKGSKGVEIGVEKELRYQFNSLHSHVPTFTPWNCAASVPSTLTADTSKTFLFVRVLLAQISLCLEILSGAKFRLHIGHWANPAFGANFGFSEDFLVVDWPRDNFFAGDRVTLFWNEFALVWKLFLLLLLLLLSLEDALEKFDSFLGSGWGVVFVGEWILSKL